MSRLSNKEMDSVGDVWNGFDYTLQAWVEDGLVQRCGHRDAFDCGCSGKRYEGTPIRRALALEAKRT